ncbi:MAG: L,D-transpeptidase [Ktedonobacteraceae bacterium]|nr:L,D-transpeptidase [Ktedonobacteraceae bacterium]MBO0790593.1 L,D-transpeptidase [Ktedonobacteraceae bacterium]
MYATGWSNVRNIPDTAGTLLRTLAPAAQVTVYGKAEGQALGNGSIWYRLSGKGSSPQYVYGGLVTTQKPVIDGGGTNLPGKVIKVSLAQQKLYAYNNGQIVFSALVATGRPELPTPAGTYHIFVKQSPTTFYSPWPEGSPYYYPPTHINYAMEFKEGGFFLHDATWRYAFGPGSNVPHSVPGGGTETGTHGCVTMTLANAAWLYQWAPIGTTVIIY